MFGSSAGECVEHADNAKPDTSSKPNSRSCMADAYHDDRAARDRSRSRPTTCDFEAEVVDADNEITDSALTAHGLLAGEALRAVRLAAIRDVTLPLLSGQSVTLRLEVKRHGRRLELE